VLTVKCNGYLLPSCFISPSVDLKKLEELHAIIVSMDIDPVLAGQYLTSRIDGETLYDMSLPKTLRDNIVHMLAEHEAEGGDSYQDRLESAVSTLILYPDSQLVDELNDYYDNDDEDDDDSLLREVRRFQATQGIISALKE